MEASVVPPTPKRGPSRGVSKARSQNSLRRKRTAKAAFAPQPDSRLLQLPAELRNTIYEYALHRPDDRIRFYRLRLPCLVFTCRQTVLETPSIFFTCNAFSLTLRETGHARIPRLLDPPAFTSLSMLRQFGAKNIPIKDVRFEKQQPLCGSRRNDTKLLLLATIVSPPTPDSSWLQITEEAWPSWKPTLDDWKLRDPDRGPTIEEVIEVGLYMRTAFRVIYKHPLVWLYVNWVYRNVRKLNEWRANGAIPGEFPIRANDRLQRIRTRAGG
ncbi:hypothetical protein CLAFUW4_09687 [Fulvia fulva]|uniref:F-box domain-containing protein n=1 Tax=Passalora fulva TaxID=5499 RepID=A0A9Q8PGU1_PASFU|nr:uncharacterized protein CLAFUR5_09781 [Fulvia fulva]KAK4614069.1 hypothetical protein CLAFUR4_09692 [Fulvia fulva]KAK4614750.1 hypothetical protein CLAFUR0_09683 [Fulvia fulva]UJO22142.1 hypothetical protein CLAFUR5_09781 [Fulvia fulva]WPV20450.1 hypothetical protein CLAFUW4_09687 [Fulvia fulva]WPV34869.1 hypothetical protein CLAFUW7_09688 [Fulvia fulva]